MPDPAIPVQVTGWTWTTVFTGGSLVTLVGLFVRQMVPWRRQVSDEREADFTRLRGEIAQAKADASEAKTEAKAATNAAQRLENMVACMRPAISILRAEVERLDPDSTNNPALRQVTELLAMAATGDFGVMPGIRRMAEIKGTGE